MPIGSREVGKAHVEISADLTKLNDALDKAKKESEQATKGISAQMEAVGNGMATVGQSLYKNVTKPIMNVGKQALNMAMDAGESENLFTVSMGNMANAARTWSEDLGEALNLNSYELRKMVGTFNVMFDSMGLATDEAYDMSTSLTELAYDMASFYNLDPEEAFTKLQAGMTGEAEQLKRLGILIDENTIKQVAYREGIAAMGEELTAQEKVQARYVAIMEQTSKAQGDMAATLESPANRLRALRESLSEVAIEFGDVMLPLFEKAVEAVQGVTDWLSKLDDRQKEQVVKWAAVAAALGPVLIGVGKMITGIPALVSGLKTIAPVLATIKANLLTILTNPITLGLAALAAIIIQIINKAKTLRQVKSEIEENYKDMQAAHDEYVKKMGDEAAAAARKGYDMQIDKLKEQLAAEDQFMADSEDRWAQYYDEQVALQKDALNEQLYDLEDNYNDRIDEIRKEYGYVADAYESKTDAANKYWDNEINRANEAYNKKIELIDKELAEQLRLVDQDAYKELQDLNNQIAALEGLTEAEREQERRRNEQAKIAKLERDVANAEEGQDRIDAQAELDGYLAELAYEHELRLREAKIEGLQNQMQDIRDNAEEKKAELETDAQDERDIAKTSLEGQLEDIEWKRDQEILAIQDERKAKEKEERLKYEATKQGILDQLEEVENGVGEYHDALLREISDKELAEALKYTATKASIDKQIEEYERLAEAQAESARKIAEQEAQQDTDQRIKEMRDLFQATNVDLQDYLAQMEDKGLLAQGMDAWSGESKAAINQFYREMDRIGNALKNMGAAGFEDYTNMEDQDKVGIKGYWEGLKDIFGFASGGVVSDPSVVAVAENEPELIIPQSRFNEVIRAAQRSAQGAAGGPGGEVNHVHSGEIKVTGVDSTGQLVDVIDVAIKDILRQEARAYG